MVSNGWKTTFGILLFLCSIYLVNWQADRSDFIFILSFYFLAFLAYLYIISNKQEYNVGLLITVTIAANSAVLFNLPNLSDDFYRFLWDGKLFWSGVNPYDYTPLELYENGFTQSRGHLNTLYHGLSELSQHNYSCYPPLNQTYFILASGFSNSIVVNTITLKILILLTEIIGAFYLLKTFKFLKIDEKRIWILYLNPLWIIETVGNVHFEGVMISFLIIGFYHVLKSRIALGGLFFAIAVQIKLVPLLLLPFFYRFLGIKKSILFYGVIFLALFVTSPVLLNLNNIAHFSQSLNLYFRVFEFNSFIFHFYIQYGIADIGWNMSKTYGPQLARIALLMIMILALYGQIDNWRHLFRRMTIAFFIYLLLSTTIHPWYVLPLLALSLFTPFGFAIVWSFLVFLSYSIYAYANENEPILEVLRLVEYLLLIVVFFIELKRSKPIFNFLHLKKK